MAITRRQRGTKLQKLGARAKGTAPKEYREEGATKRGQYADPKRYKYPLHKAENVRAAISYFGDAKNRQGYSAAEQRSIAKRIVAAARKHKIAVDPGSAVGRLAGLKRGNPGKGRSKRPGAISRMRGRLKGMRD